MNINKGKKILKRVNLGTLTRKDIASYPHSLGLEKKVYSYLKDKCLRTLSGCP